MFIMSKLKKTIITLCLSIGAVIIISIGAYAAIKHTIVDQLIEKNASTCNKELKLTTGNIEDPIEKEAAGIYNSEMAAKYETALENGYRYEFE